MTEDHLKPPVQQIVGAFIDSTVKLFAPTLHTTFTYGPEWFSDASREARTTGHSARRREILFAVCAAESALFEWVRDTVLHRDFVALAKFFPTRRKRGVAEKFRDIPKELVQQGCIATAFDCGGSEFSEFRRLVDYRDGLVHALASRPDRVDLPREQKPVPTKDELDALPPGWALTVVRALLKKLHDDTGTDAPAWLEDGAR